MARELTIAVFLSGLLCVLTMRLLLASRLRELALDHPNERSLHARVTPRTGGLAILCGATAGTALLGPSDALALWCLSLLLGAVSFLDDRMGLPIALRLVVQLAVASLAAWQVGLSLPYWWLPILVLGTVWTTNLYNFMDGSDALAGGMGLIGFLAYSSAFGLSGQVEFCVLCAALASACLGFLFFNYPPASVFMGDAGSTAIGFTAATVGFWGIARGTWPFWFPALVFLPFALDATVTLLRRALRREKVWQAHREHYYQRLIRGGFTHSEVARGEHLLMALVGASALLTLRYAPHLGWAVLLLWVAVLGVLMRRIDVWYLRRDA